MLIEIDNLTLEHPGKMLCRGLSVTINPGECWAILGRNGCGKSTLLNALAGLHPMKDGGQQVRAGGKAPSAWPQRDFAHSLGFLLQEEPEEFWGDVREYVLLGRYPYSRSLFGWQALDHEIATKALERMELTNVAHRPLATLSGGERQRARIALLLAQSPLCYLLDEPLQHLDLRHQRATLALFHELASQGRTVVMVLHDANWAARFCSHALLLFDDGCALAGQAEKVLNRVNLETLYHCPIREIGTGSACHFVPADVPARV